MADFDSFNITTILVWHSGKNVSHGSPCLASPATGRYRHASGITLHDDTSCIDFIQMTGRQRFQFGRFRLHRDGHDPSETDAGIINSGRRGGRADQRQLNGPVDHVIELYLLHL